jgi:hypothetical protein
VTQQQPVWWQFGLVKTTTSKHHEQRRKGMGALRRGYRSKRNQPNGAGTRKNGKTRASFNFLATAIR